MSAVLAAFARILTKPHEVYALIEERRPVLWPALVVTAVTLASSLLMLPALRALIQEQVMTQPDLPPDAAAFAQQVGVWLAVLGSPVMVLIFALVTAGLLSLGAMLGGGSLPYRTGLSLSLLASSPLLLRQLVVAALVAAGLTANPETVVTSAALVLPADSAGTALYRILNLIDPLEWWFAALLAGGVHRLGGTSTRAGWVVAAAVWLLLYASFKIAA